MKYHKIDFDVNAEKSCLSVFSPLKKDKTVGDCGYRIAGPKAWGGFSNLASVNITETPLINFIKKKSPILMEALKNGENYIAPSFSYRLKCYKSKSSNDLKIVIESKDGDFFIAGLKTLNEKDCKVFSAKMSLNSLLTYVREYCSPSAVRKILS